MAESIAPSASTASAAPTDSAAFIERMGLFWDSEGLPRIAGRLFGLLFLQSGECSLDDMAAALGVSKASVSTDIRRLQAMGFVERTSRPGDRRDYYAIARGVTVNMVALRRARIERFRDAIFGAASLEETHPVVRDRLRIMEIAHRHIVAALDGIVEELEANALDQSMHATSETAPQETSRK
ncbi:MAG TPA: MarR family transcriptional regulator [Gemmatimonadaceae bacterium]|nr:MarR family transcriptional regulator [Gemmatimonadaceae bacterium]